MCTVSVIPLRSANGDVVGLRLVSNRDEHRDRPRALPERWHELANGTRGLWPTDPIGGGTWIAGTSSGVALSLLNVNLPKVPRGSVSRGGISRGGIIPFVASAPSTLEALERASALDLSAYSPFRLVAADAQGGMLTIGDLRWDGQCGDLTWHRSGPIAFVSSGLGDEVVEPRLGVFESMVAADPSVESQDRFHRHGRDEHSASGRLAGWWPGRWSESVCMSRVGARTVSITSVEVVGDRVTVTTEPIEETPEQWERVLARGEGRLSCLTPPSTPHTLSPRVSGP